MQSGKSLCSGHPLAVLFVVTVLRHDELGRQGDHLCAAWAHDHRSNRRMVVEGLALGSLTPETVGAMNGLGGKVLRPIQGQQQLVCQASKGGERAVLLKAIKDLQIHPIEVMRHYGIEQVADLIITGKRLNPKQRTGIILSLGLLEMALVLQKRRRLGEKDAKSAQSGILDAVTGVRPVFAMIR
jgi:hypothetical protein